jgi:hypothetical protein
VIGLPPSSGATNETVASLFPDAATGCSGAAGAMLGMAGADGADGGPSPFALVAVTVHVYDFPFDKPPTTIGELGPDAEPGVPPSDDAHAASYVVIALPPSNGVGNDTVSCALPAMTAGCAGAEGTVLGVTWADSGEDGLWPSAFVAVTVQVYELPFDKPTTTIGEPVPAAIPAVPPCRGAHCAS